MKMNKDRRYITRDPKTLQSILPRLTRPALRRHGFPDVSLLQDWEYIVGETWAQQTSPARIWFKKGQRGNGTLYINVYGASAVFLQHIVPQLIARVNQFFGYNAVAEIRFNQCGAKPIAAEEKLIPVKHKSVDDFTEGPLKEALERLGGALEDKT